MNGPKQEKSDEDAVFPRDVFPEDAFPEDAFPEDAFPEDVFPRGDEDGDESQEDY